MENRYFQASQPLLLTQNLEDSIFEHKPDIRRYAQLLLLLLLLLHASQALEELSSNFRPALRPPDFIFVHVCKTCYGFLEVLVHQNSCLSLPPFSVPSKLTVLCLSEAVERSFFPTLGMLSVNSPHQVHHFFSHHATSLLLLQN